MIRLSKQIFKKSIPSPSPTWPICYTSHRNLRTTALTNYDHRINYSLTYNRPDSAGKGSQRHLPLAYQTGNLLLVPPEFKQRFDQHHRIGLLVRLLGRLLTVDHAFSTWFVGPLVFSKFLATTPLAVTEPPDQTIWLSCLNMTNAKLLTPGFRSVTVSVMLNLMEWKTMSSHTKPLNYHTDLG